MKMNRISAALLALVLLVAPARADQATLATPGVGETTMATLRTYLNAVMPTLAGCFSGVTAPAVGIGSVPIPYQCWADTSLSPVINFKVYNPTLSSWTLTYTLDLSTGAFTPNLGTTAATLVTLSGAQTLTNKVFNCANNTCTVRLGSDVTGNLPLSNIAAGSADTVLGYWAGTGLSALSIPNCSNSLTYSTATHTLGCNTGAGTGTVSSIALVNGTGVSIVVGSGANPCVTACSLTVNVDKATAGNYYAGSSNKVVTTDVIYPTELPLGNSGSGTLALDTTTFVNAAVIMTGNITTVAWVGVAGKAGTIRFAQDGTGSRTVIWPTALKWAGGSVPALSTGANVQDYLNYNCITASICQASLSKGVQ